MSNVEQEAEKLIDMLDKLEKDHNKALAEQQSKKPMTQYYEKVSVQDSLPEKEGWYTCFYFKEKFTRSKELYFMNGNFSDNSWNEALTHWLRPIDKLESLLQGDAVEFLEWVNFNGFVKNSNNKYFSLLDPSYLDLNKPFTDTPSYNTAELYKKYQEEKK